MRNRFDNQLEKLNNELIEMGSMIEQAIEKAISALVNNDVELAKTVIEGDEDIDHQERRIESLCMKLLLQQQPVAKDFRLISSALKMITDMERIGDHAADISEMTSGYMVKIMSPILICSKKWQKQSQLCLLEVLTLSYAKISNRQKKSLQKMIL